MNKNELADYVAKKSEISKADAVRVIDAAIDGITEALKGGDEVRLVGFGTFYVSETKAREGRNPRTGEKLQIEGGKNAKFKAGKALKDGVNGEDAE